MRKRYNLRAMKSDSILSQLTNEKNWWNNSTVECRKEHDQGRQNRLEILAQERRIVNKLSI